MGFTKLDLAKLYGELAERMLPYVANRPLTLVRCEKGVTRSDALRSECKFLRHEPGYHRWVREPVRRVRIAEQKKLGEYLVVDSAAGIVSLVQGDIIELHVWNATLSALETPDRIVFDLDPGAAVAWADVVDAAHLLRSALAQLELESWAKLSGGKGVHVVVPLEPEHDWATVYAFSRGLAEALARLHPQRFTLVFSKQNRDNKILIDYKRNHRAAVSVAAYSARAAPSAAVSTPLAWRELTPEIGPEHFTVRNVLARLKRRADPWRGFWKTKQRLGPLVLRSSSG